MTARARHQTLIATTLAVLLLVAFASGLLIFMPIHLSGTRQLTVLMVGGGSVGIGEASSQATVHYDDGTSEKISGATITLLPVFKQAAITLAKNPVSADWAAEVVIIANFDLQKYCKTAPLGLWKVCPQDAFLKVTTDIAITVDGRVVAKSPSNGQRIAFWMTGYVSQHGGLDLGLPTFETNKATSVFSLPDFDVTPYRQSDRSVTVSLTGTQTFELYPVFIDPLTGRYYPDVKTNIICGDKACTKPYTVTYSDPTFQIPSTTVTTPDYQLSVTPTSLTISTNPANDGNMGYVQVSALAYNGLTGTFHISNPQLPEGITMHFETPNDQQVTASNALVGIRLKFISASSTNTGNYTATIATTIGSVAHSITIPITVNANIITCPGGANCPTIATVLTASLSQTEVSAYFPFQVNGQLVTTGGGAVPSANIYAQPTWGTGESGATGTNGKFSITLFAPNSAGTYDIHVTFAGDSQYAAAQSVTLRITIRQADWTMIIIAVGVLAIVIIAIVGYAISQRRPGMARGHP
jgi:hypothetical protein